MLKSTLGCDNPLWLTLGGLTRSLPPPQLSGGGINLCQEPPVSAARAGSVLAGLIHLHTEALPAQHRKHLCKSAPKNVAKWPLFLLGRRLWQLGLPTHQTGTAGTHPQPCTPGCTPAPGQQPPPSSSSDHQALTSLKTSQSLIISVNMQIADVSLQEGLWEKQGMCRRKCLLP